MKRTLALVLAVILLLATAAFADDNFNETGLPLVKEKVEVEVLASTTAADPNNFPMIQKIEEATNVHINWNCISPDGKSEKIALMWASEDLPEVFGPGTVSADDINTYGPMGYILPLNDLIDKYAVNFNTYLTEKGILDEVKAKMTSPDGNIYAFSTTGIQYKNNMGGMFYNKTWLSQKMDASALSGYKIWLAQYAAAPTYTGRYDLWQYKSTGKVSGISGNVDLNLSYLGY